MHLDSQEHPDAKLYRNKRFLHYDKLALLLEGTPDTIVCAMLYGI